MKNKVILIGNVGNDPETRTLESGTIVTNFRLATSEKIYNKQTQEAREETAWHSITMFGKLAEITDKYVTKGMTLYLEGKITYNEWTDKDGNKRSQTRIVADEMKMLSKKEARSENLAAIESASAQETKQYAEEQGIVDNLPF